jgi:hypothetical protein
MYFTRASIAIGIAGAMISPATLAGEGLVVRYNLAGSLGGEMFAPPNASGLAAGIAYTNAINRKVTGDDGNLLTLPVAGGAVPLPSPTPAALYPTYGPNTATVDGTGTLKITTLALGYVTEERFNGGRLAFGLALPYAEKDQIFAVSAATPALQWNPAIPASTQAAVGTQFGAGYQSKLAAQAAAASGQVSGMGDAEIQVGWLYTDDKLRVIVGAALVLPTGTYDKGPAPDIGQGNFYTLRPAVQVAYLVTPDFAVAGKFTLGLNTTNTDNDLRSGNWAGLEGAVGYKTPVGVVGLHSVYVQQYSDDTNNPYGPSRFQSQSYGAFFTTKAPVIDAALTLQYIATTSSKNARTADFTQLRIVKLF